MTEERLSKEVRLRELWAANVPVHEIRAELHMSSSTLHDWTKRLGLPVRKIPPPGDYPEHEIETIKRLFREGKSAAEIARTLKTRTRNAVIGKMQRMGLTRPDPRDFNTGRAPSAPKPRAAPKPKPVRAPKPPKPRAQNPHAGRPGYISTSDHREVEKVRAIQAGEGRTFSERVDLGCGVESLNPRPFLEATGCKWPIKREGRTLYCCNPVMGGDSYGRFWCGGHYRVGVQRGQPRPIRERAADHMARHERAEPMRRAA